mmetsp:Transcript_5835/g.17250  ORF Transcript_5835/g.17250 Transcript_5835/m.17250 type:complete len:203 (+) Transcript_5835:1122-1730(+)
MIRWFPCVDQVGVRNSTVVQVFYDSPLGLLLAHAMVCPVAGYVDVNHGAHDKARHILLVKLTKENHLRLREAARCDHYDHLKVAQAYGVRVAAPRELLRAGTREVPEPRVGVAGQVVHFGLCCRLVDPDGCPVRVATLHATKAVDEQRLPNSRVPDNCYVNLALRHGLLQEGRHWVIPHVVLHLLVLQLYILELCLPLLQLL